jgi:hypothetical protein
MEHHLVLAESLTDLLDNRFTIFGFRFGLDPLLDLIPWAGDLLAAFLSLYLVWIGLQIGLPQERIHQMLRNILIDFLIGAVPFLGVIGDALYRANSRNMKILREYAPRIVEAKIIS